LIDFKQAFNAPTPKSMDDSMKQAKASPKVRAMIRMIDENVSYYTRMTDNRDIIQRMNRP
jgi:hypothetical protein